MTRASPPLVFWTPERIEVLTDLWCKGFSASQIAKRIGGCSRSSVIGKIHRMGLQSRSVEAVNAALAIGGRQKLFRASGEKPPKRLVQSRAQTYPRQPRPVWVDRPVSPVDAAHARPWLTRTFGECAAPVGGEGADTLSCCTPCGDHTYCKAHRAILFVKPKESAARLTNWGVRFAA